jgi:Cof subfamily protein (haloacid dehalogenase superfamily)
MKAIIVDLDRTLLHTNKTISDYSLQVLKKCHEKGILIMAATARPERAILEYHSQVHFDAMAVTNGARVCVSGQELGGYPVARESVKVILEQLCKMPDVVISLECGQEVYSNIEIPEWEAIVYHEFPKLPTEGTIYKILASRENENIGLLVETLLTEDTYCTVANENLVQIMNKKATKWNGIRMMLEACSITSEQAVYFGDDNDDIEPLKQCGTGVAVANAIDAVKEAADVVVESNDEDGVAKWIERNLLA